MGDSWGGGQKMRMLMEMWKEEVILMRFQIKMKTVENWTKGFPQYTVAKNFRAPLHVPSFWPSCKFFISLFCSFISRFSQ